MARPASPCPFYRMPCEYVPMAHRADELEQENAKLRAALKPFANALKGNWSHQSDEMPIDAGFGASDLRLRFRLGDFRVARDVLGGDNG